MPRKTLEEKIKQYHEMSRFENTLRAEGYQLIAGVDEVGRGPLAGPVMAGALILPSDEKLVIPGVDDSKKLTPLRRAALFEEIQEKAIAWAVGTVDVETIDCVNILQATKQAMKLAVEALRPQAEALLIDAVHLEEVLLPQRSIIKGDGSWRRKPGISGCGRWMRSTLNMDSLPIRGMDRHSTLRRCVSMVRVHCIGAPSSGIL